MTQGAQLSLGGGADATLSPCGRYRYTLTRWWGTGPRALWVMLNPSTADASADDPTIRRVRSFTAAAGCDGFTVVNLFAWRATDPRGLFNVLDPFGPGNLHHISDASNLTAGPIVCAWGAHPMASAAAPIVMAALPADRLRCLGRTKDGAPRHPLYVPAAARLEIYP